MHRHQRNYTTTGVQEQSSRQPQVNNFFSSAEESSAAAASSTLEFEPVSKMCPPPGSSNQQGSFLKNSAQLSNIIYKSSKTVRERDGNTAKLRTSMNSQPSGHTSNHSQSNSNYTCKLMNAAS